MPETSVFDEITQPRKPHWLPVNLVLAYAVGMLLLCVFWLNSVTGNMDSPGKVVSTADAALRVISSKLILLPLFIIAIPLALIIRRGFGWTVLLVLFEFICADILFQSIKHAADRYYNINDLWGLPIVGVAIYLLNSYSLKRYFNRDTKSLLLKENIIAAAIATILAGWMVFG